MKKTHWIVASSLVVGFLFLSSCGSSPTTINGNWIGVGSSVSFAGATRSGAFEFTIGNQAYVGLGFGGKNNNQYLQDCYVFNPDSGFWKQVAPFPGVGRELSVSFSLGNKGYVGTGYNRYITDINFVELGDFWVFDPTGDTVVVNAQGQSQTLPGSWKRLHDFAGNPRYSALAFVVGTGVDAEEDQKAYVGTGYDGTYYADCYQYLPATDTWKRVHDFPGAKREGAMTFTIDGVVYYFGGDSNGIYNSDFWKYDPNAPTNVPGVVTWQDETEVTTNGNYNDFRAAVRRSFASAFVMSDGNGYVVCGTTGTPSTLTYQYNPLPPYTWTRMTAFETSARYQAVSFVLNNGQAAYVATGLNGTRRFDDMAQWQPTVAYNQAD